MAAAGSDYLNLEPQGEIPSLCWGWSQLKSFLHDDGDTVTVEPDAVIAVKHAVARAEAARESSKAEVRSEKYTNNGNAESEVVGTPNDGVVGI